MQIDLFGKPPDKPKKKGKGKYSHSKSNTLARQVKAYVNFHKGAVAYRLSYGMRVKTKTGRIATGEIISAIFKTGQDNGLPDVFAIVFGRFVAIEIKIGKDSMSDVQEEVKDSVIRAGGEFWEVKTITQFKKMFDDLYRSNQ